MIPPYLMALADGFLPAITGPEDGGVKASPVPSDSEKPGTPGEGMLSSDLDRIPTEGEITRIFFMYKCPPLKEMRVLLVGLIFKFL